MNVDLRKPDFFIVGAPKSGTSSLRAHLRPHPEVYLTVRVEMPMTVPIDAGDELHDDR